MPFRKDWIRHHTLIRSTVLILWMLQSHQCAAETMQKPNILVIMTDEHHAGVMGCAGDTIARTPNLDALASRGIIFDACYCTSPICIPSRQSFTTGKYVSRHNVWGNTRGVREGSPSLPRVLNAAGYESYLIGKMHYKGGMNHGYVLLDHGKGRETVDDPKDSPRLRQRLPAGVFPDRGDSLGEEFHPLGESPDMESFVDVDRRKRAIQFLQEGKPGKKPFFLTVGFIAPHYPLVAPPELLAHFKDKVSLPEIPDGLLDQLPLNYRHLRNDRKFERVPSDTVKRAREAYYARVEWTDQQIGAVLDALQASPFAENTVVVYTSDHGENLGEHGLWWKNCMYDSAARVPLIVSWPLRWKGPQRRGGACGALDLVQTLCELGGARPPTDWNGRSFLRWLDDSQTPWRDLAVSEFYSDYIASGMAMIRQRNWKYVYHCRADSRHGPERELFDLMNDPKELRNLAADPMQQARMTALHAALVTELGEDPEETEARWRSGAIPEAPQGVKTIPGK